MSTPSAIKGFPVLLPEECLFQQKLIRIVEQHFELHGYTPLRTPSVQPMTTLLTKGETDKEIYQVSRRVSGEGDKSSEPASLGLCFDLTVPFARYVADKKGELIFPFRRYQVQTAWRGERPQLGRYREFIQADADIVARGELGVHADSELVRLLATTVGALPIPAIRLMVNNRKLLQGYFEALGATDMTAALRALDKMPKIGEEKTCQLLVETSGLTVDQAKECIQFLAFSTSSSKELRAHVGQVPSNELLEAGCSELAAVLDACADLEGETKVIASFHIARGFDYYTGTVVEGVFDEHDDLPSVCSGGRYDQLIDGGKESFPGMGVSIGISRIIGFMQHLKLPLGKRRTPAQALVALISQETRPESEELARRLRAANVSAVVAAKPDAFGKQIKHAVKLGVRYVWFPKPDGGQPEVRDLESGEQSPQDPVSWASSFGKV